MVATAERSVDADVVPRDELLRFGAVGLPYEQAKAPGNCSVAQVDQSHREQRQGRDKGEHDVGECGRLPLWESRMGTTVF